MSRELQPCGTNAAYVRHRKHGEKPCEPCRKAHAAYVLERMANKPAYQLKDAPPCGTQAAYQRHRRWQEEPCVRCKQAAKAASAAQRAKKRRDAS